MIQLRTMDKTDLPRYKSWMQAPHVTPWFTHPLAWIEEVEQQDGAFRWIHHFIAEHDAVPVGFCQYYACQDSDELWEGYTALGGSYSIDYLIGQPEFLRKGYCSQMVAALLQKISLHPDAKRVVVQPDTENTASQALLLSCGFKLDLKTGIYLKTL